MDLRSDLHTRLADDTFAQELVRSIDRSAGIFGYHIATARDAMHCVIDSQKPQGQANWEILLGVDAERRTDFEYAKIVSEAHLLGCAYTARSLLETFAQLVNEALLNAVIPISNCTLKEAAKRLPEGELKGELQSLLSSYWFNYLSAFVNTVKHRQLVPNFISISSVENAVGMQIGAFVYQGNNYPPYWLNAVLEGVISIKNAVISAGRALNRALAQSDTLIFNRTEMSDQHFEKQIIEQMQSDSSSPSDISARTHQSK